MNNSLTLGAKRDKINRVVFELQGKRTLIAC